MGNAESRNNPAFIDHLVRRDIITHRNVERAFRLVDRALFLPNSDHAYSTLPLMVQTDRGGELCPGRLHLSSIDVTVSVVQHLQIEKGHSFLNIGSGSGYLSTIIGILLGGTGANHGIELYPNLVKYSNRCIDKWSESDGASSVDATRADIRACDVHNLEFLEQHSERYDRIYVSFVILDQKVLSRVMRMLKDRGILIAPDDDNLRWYQRISENECVSTGLGRMTFSRPDMKSEQLPTPVFERMPTLCHLARQELRRFIRKSSYSPKVLRDIRRTMMVPKGGNTNPELNLNPHGLGHEVGAHWEAPPELQEINDDIINDAVSAVPVPHERTRRGRTRNPRVNRTTVQEKDPLEMHIIRNYYVLFDDEIGDLTGDELSDEEEDEEEEVEEPVAKKSTRDQQQQTKHVSFNIPTGQRCCDHEDHRDLEMYDDTAECSSLDLFPNTDDEEEYSTYTEDLHCTDEQKRELAIQRMRRDREDRCANYRAIADVSTRAANEHFQRLIQELPVPRNIKNYIRYMNHEVALE